MFSSKFSNRCAGGPAQDFHLGILVIGNYTPIPPYRLDNILYRYDGSDNGADQIKKAIRGLPGLGLFLEKEGGLVRWHAQF